MDLKSILMVLNSLHFMKSDSCSDKKEFFEIFCVLPIRLSELWSWFCFENDCLGIEIIDELTNESIYRVFFDKRPNGGAKKMVEEFQSKISHENNIIILEENIKPVKNWQQNWSIHFSPKKIGKSLVILPSSQKKEKFLGRYPIWINPGQAFGTGHHISTILALEKLEKYLLSLDNLPEKMFDIGIGSGILAIAACRLGVSNVKGIDIDVKTLGEVKKNIKLNGLRGRIESYIGQPSLLNDKASLVICNMLLSEILSVQTHLNKITSTNGVLICSGLLKGQEIKLVDALSEMGFCFSSILEKQKWCAISFKKV
tara:strand:- start:175 stop:1113 length:939 start_codon:yes stop_codon:yes gene_type:complete